MLGKSSIYPHTRSRSLGSLAVIAVAVVSLGLLGAPSGTAAGSADMLQPFTPVPPASESSATAHYGRLPLAFTPVRDGQFEAHTMDGTVSLSRQGVEVAGVSLDFVGSSTSTRVTGARRLPGTANYLRGSRKHWRTGVPMYAQVNYRQLWPGVDAVFEGRNGRLEYDFKVAPGADPSAVVLRVRGVRSISVDRDGALVMRTSHGNVRQLAPHTYQEVNGARRTVRSRYKVSDGRVHIVTGTYDNRLPLVIDPALGYATYLGGSDNDSVHGIAVDASGATYVAGTTASTNFPARTGLADAPSPGPGAFVAKVGPDGQTLEYATFIGDNTGGALDIAIDAAGSAYVVGTAAPGFPTTPGQTRCGAGNPPGDTIDAFVAKLSPDGRNLEYSTCLGGSGEDYGQSIATDPTGAAYVTGYTLSPDFAVKNAAQANFGGGRGADAFVSKIDVGGTLAYSTYLGGDDSDQGAGIAVDGAGAAYVTGHTTSSNFPTRGGLRSTLADQDAFVTKLDPTGQTFAYSTLLGGSNSDVGRAIALDDAGAAYVTGETTSVDFPTRHAQQPTNLGGVGAFVSKLEPSGQSLDYSTYLGSSTQGYGVTVTARGEALVVGRARSGRLPIDVPVHTQGQAHHSVGGDGFLTRFSADGRSVTYSAFFGGRGNDIAYDVGVDPAGNAYIAGESGSKDLPTHRAMQSTYAGGRIPRPTDGFVARLRLGTAPAATPGCHGRPATIVGTGRHDIIHGVSSAEVISSRRGPDTVSGGGGKDVLCLGHGDDHSWGNNDGDRIFGAPGADQLHGGAGGDYLNGGQGPDRLHGDPGHDTLYGNRGNDDLQGGKSDDKCHPGPGRDSTRGC
jgi:hypothetical protein